MTRPTWIDEIRYDDAGLVPVSILDERTGALLTLAYANRDALERTLETGSTWLWSRSRQALWNKGATSGHTQHVVSIAIDCDADALAYRVIPHGPACHTGAMTCFDRVFALDTDGTAPSGARFATALVDLAATIAARKIDPPEGSYTATLFAGGVDRIAKKIGEEATEVVIAAKNDDPGELTWEVADLLYHTLVMLAERNVSLDAVGAELARRAK